jgi:hypothetical protein
LVEVVDHQGVGCGLLPALADVPDPHSPRARHRISTILAVAVCAMLAGCRSFTAIGEWAANASEQLLAAFGAWGKPMPFTTIVWSIDGGRSCRSLPAMALADKTFRLRDIFHRQFVHA